MVVKTRTMAAFFFGTEVLPFWWISEISRMEKYGKGCNAMNIAKSTCDHNAIIISHLHSSSGERVKLLHANVSSGFGFQIEIVALPKEHEVAWERPRI